MINIDKDYLITVDLKNTKVKSDKTIFFYNTDLNICNIFIKLICTDEDKTIPEDLIVEFAVLKPETDEFKPLDATLISKEDLLYQVDLTTDYFDIVGTYECEIRVSGTIENELKCFTSEEFDYVVKPNITAKLNKKIKNDKNLPILEKLIKDVKEITDGINKDEIQMKRDENLVGDNKTVVGAINQLREDVNSGIGGGTVDLKDYQKKNDEFLNTDEKTITGGINEVNNKIKKVQESQIELDKDDVSFNGIDDISHDELNTTNKTLIGAINEVNSQVKDVANIGTKEKLSGKFKSVKLEEILLEIYNKIYGTVDEPVNPLAVTIGNTIPRIDFTSDVWDTMRKDKPIIVQSKITFNNLVCNGYAEVKWQGSSSLNYPKKNYTAKFYEDNAKSTKQKINIQLNTDSRKWGNENKFVFKANYIDKTHARNVVSARIASKMLKTRSDYNSLPDKLKNAPNYGLIDGFPAEIYLNNEYLGLYTWNIPKDGWTFGMTEKDYSEIVICSEVPTDYCLYRAEPTHEHWSEEYPGDSIGTDGVLDKWKIAEAFVRTSDDATFTSQLSQHFNINSLLDYYIFCYLCCDIDGLGKNQLICSYDGGNTWIYSLYDLDSTFGLYWNGSKLVSSSYRCPEDYETYATNKDNGEYNLLFEKICRLFPSELYARYRELRQDVLSNANLISEFTAFKNHLPDEYYTRDGEKWTDIPSKDITSFEQIQTFINERCTYVDNMFETLFNKTTVDVSSITITGDTTTEVGNTIQLSAVVSPTSASNKSVTWSSNNNDIATINENGLVTTKTTGIIIITATSVSNSSIKATYTITITAKIEDKDRLVTEGLQSRWLFMEDSAREIDSVNQTLIFKDTVSNDNLKFPKAIDEAQDIAVIVNNNSSLDGFSFGGFDSNKLGVIEDNTNVNKTEYTLEVCIKLMSDITSKATLITKFPQIPSKVFLYGNGNLGGTIGNTWFEKKTNLSNHVNDDVVTLSFKIMPTRVEVYIDGISIGYSTVNITTIDSSGSAILCGSNTNQYKFKEIRYYNRALTDEEITNNNLYTKDKYKTV